jgi:hypothetical protein
MRPSGTDAVGVLRWGLRRYRLLVLLCVLVCGAITPFAALRVTPTSHAEAVVIANRLNIDLVALPRYGEAVFSNGQVEQAVEARFGSPGGGQDIIPDRVSLVADQDSILFRVVGHDEDPKKAADIANVAVEPFIQALNAGGASVGTFGLQARAVPPPAPDRRLDTVLAVAVGVVAGLLLGLAIVSALLVARRPVVDGSDAEELTGVPALGTVVVPRTRRGRFARPERFIGLIPVCRRLLSLPTPTLALVSRRREERMRQQLTVALATVLGRVRTVDFIGPVEMLRNIEHEEHAAQGSPGDADGHRPGPRPTITLIDSGEPLDLVQPPELTATVLVVREGTSAGALRAAVVEHLGGSAEARLLLVRRGRRTRGFAAPPEQDTGEASEREAVAAADER